MNENQKLCLTKTSFIFRYSINKKVDLITYENDLQISGNEKVEEAIDIILKKKYKYIAYLFYLFGLYDLEIDIFLKDADY